MQTAEQNTAEVETAGSEQTSSEERLERLEQRINVLEGEVAELKDQLRSNTIQATSYTRDASVLPGP